MIHFIKGLSEIRIKKILLALNFLSALVLMLSPFVLFPVCQELRADGTRMKCFDSGIFITVIAVLILIVLALSFLFNKFPNLSLSFASVLAFACWFVPEKFIGLCGNPQHACRAITMPYVGVFAALIVLLSFTGLIFNFIGGKD